MSERIDAELKKVTRTEQVAKAIHVGSDLFYELYREKNPIYAAPLIGPNEEAPVYQRYDVKEYKGIPVLELPDPDVPADYLKIII